MRIVRSPREKAYSFAKEHLTPFTSAPAAVGLTVPQAAQYTAAVNDLRDALDAVGIAKQALRTSVNNANEKYRVMNQVMTQTVELIDIFAQNSADPQEVYNTAEIDPPTVPSAAPAPAKPTDLVVTLDTSSGWLNLSWKAQNPPGIAGTSYVIKRRVPGESTFSFVGVSGVRRFTDKTFIAGPDSVQYTVQGHRSDQSGPVSEVFTVTFGQSGGGLTAFVSGEGSGEGKLAA